MASLFDPGSSSTLADILGQKADTASMGITNDYAQKKRRNASMQAASGRLGSGVANYQAGDLAAGELSDLGGVQSNLADALAGIPTTDFLDQQQNNRNRQLAELIAELNKPSALQQTIGALRGGVQAAGSVMSFF